MRRHWLAVAALAALPAAAAAQLPRPSEEGWGPFIRATPFIGISPGFSSSGTLAVFDGESIVTDEYEYSFAAGAVTGVNVEVRAHQRFSGIASIAWTGRGHVQGTFISDDFEQLRDVGSDFWLAKIGGSMRFREQDPELQLRRLSASVFLAGAFIRESPNTSLSSPSQFVDARNQLGVNFGAEAELPLADRRFAFHAGLENYVIFWDKEGVQERLVSDVIAKYGTLAAAEADPDVSALWVARIGFSFRFGPDRD